MNALANYFKKDKDGHFEMPWCEVCQHPVEQVEYLTPIERYPTEGGYDKARHTGEILLSVTCHGESFCYSNHHGQVTKERFECMKGIQ